MRLLLSPTCVQTREMTKKLPKFPWSCLKFRVAQGRRFSIRTPETHKFFFLIRLSGVGYPLSWVYNQCFWCLRQSSRRAVPLEEVVLLLVHKQPWGFFSRKQRFLLVLTAGWLVFQLSIAFRLGWIFQPIWENSFCKNSRNRGNTVVCFSIWGIWAYRGSFKFSELVVKFLVVKRFCLGIQFVWLQNGTFLLSISIQLCECTWRLTKCSE